MTIVEIMALILLVVAAVKILIILVNPKAWVSVIKKVWVSPTLVMLISLVLAGVSLYYLLMELTIIQIFAVMLFVCLLLAVGISVYSKEFISMVTKLLNKDLVRKSWLYILIWIVLIVWGLKELFV